MLSLGSRERRLALAALAAAAVAAAQLGAVRPAARKVRRLRAKVAVAVNDLGRLRAVIARQSEVSAAYDAIRSRITSSRSPEREIIDMLLTIEKAAIDAGVEVQKNVHVRDESFEYFSRHTVQFAGRGKPESLFRMIHALGNPDLLLKIPEMKFAMREHRLEMELEITRVVCAPDKAS